MYLLINELIRYYWLSKELDNVAKVVIEQLNAVVETLTTIKGDPEKPVEKIEEPKSVRDEAPASDVVKNFEPAPEPVKEPAVEPVEEVELVKELEPVKETEWVQVTTKKAKKNKKKSKSKSESESKSPTPKVDEPETNSVDTKTVEAVKVSEPTSVEAEIPAELALTLEQPVPTVDETTTRTTDVVETVERVVDEVAVVSDKPVSYSMPG